MSVTATCIIESQYASSSAVSVYVAPAATRTIIDKFTATNTDGSSRTVSIYVVPSGGSANASNMIIDQLTLLTKQCYDFTELHNHILSPGDFIVVGASAATVVNIRASGRECT